MCGLPLAVEGQAGYEVNLATRRARVPNTLMNGAFSCAILLDPIYTKLGMLRKRTASTLFVNSERACGGRLSLFTIDPHERSALAHSILRIAVGEGVASVVR
jgi:hypothetical protein